MKSISQTCNGKLTGAIVESNLQKKARTLRGFLERYATADADVSEAFDWIKPLLESVEAGTVAAPQRFPVGWIFFRGDNSLLEFADLCNAAAEFASALEGDETL
jgi:CTP:molybdopterin cytidylyltransferase MocA